MNTITIKKSDGKYSREDALKVFGWIDSDIENWHCAGNDGVTPETVVGYGKMEKNGTFIDMFGNEPKTFTKAQVIDIVKNRSELLNDKGYANFFPYMNGNGDRFVLYVDRDDSEWGLRVLRLEGGGVWDAEYGHVLFLPQQDSSTLATEDALAPGHLDPSALTDEVAIAHLKDRGFIITRQF